MSNPRLSHLYNVLTAELAAKGRLNLSEALTVAEVHTFDELRLFNRVIREFNRAGIRQGNHLVAAQPQTFKVTSGRKDVTVRTAS